MERSRQLDGLRNGQRRVRLELVRRHAVDQVIPPSGLDARIVPAIGRNVAEREVAHAGTGVRIERVLRRFTRRHRDDRRRCGRQLRERHVEDLVHAALIRKHSAAAGAFPIFDIALGFCCRLYTVDMVERMSFCRDRDRIQNSLAAFIREVLTAVRAVPMLLGSWLRAGRALSFNMIFVLMQANQGEHFIRHM